MSSTIDTDRGDPVADSRPTRDLLRVVGQACAGCGGRCSAFEVVWSIALGFKEAPRCLPCLARGLGRDPGELRARLTDYVNRRECYRRAWAEAGRLEGCAGRPATVAPADPGAESPAAGEAAPALTWDAGDLACGDLVVALRARLDALPAGAEIRVRATDPAAPEDVPAWCRMTGHPLVWADHPFYVVRRKGA